MHYKIYYDKILTRPNKRKLNIIPFGGKTMALDPIETAKAEITKIYIAAFHRVPDEAGLQNWLNQYTAGLMTYDQIAENFTSQPEYLAKYPETMTNEEYVTEIYNNLFGRAPDPEGLVNWTNQLNANVFDKGTLMYAMLETAASQPNNVDSIRLENMATFSLNVLASGVSPVEATAQLDTITADPTTITAAEDAVITPTQTTQTVTTTIETAVPTPDTTPPTMASATVNSDGDIVITYNENVGGSLAEASDFVVTVDGATDAVLNASVDRYIVTLTMATKISGASTVNSIVYTAANGTPNSIQDVASNAAATQTLTTITNYSSYLTAAEAQAAYDFDNGATYLVADTAANLANPAVISAAALGQATDIGVTDTGTVTAADLNTIDNATTATISANSVTGVTGTSTEVITLLNSIITLNGSEAITLTDAANSTILAADLSAIDAATGAVTITNSVTIDGTADGASTADFIDVSGITFTSGSVTINGNDGNDSIIGGSEADIIDGGTGNDIIRGGAGVDTITGGTDNDTLVVLGAIASGDYTAADVTTGTGAYALGLTDTIVAGVATSDSGVDGTEETYDGGAGTDSIEIWGTADLSAANISGIESINTHSDLTIGADQLLTLFTNNSVAVTLNMLDDASTINITNVSQDAGMSLLNAFTPAIDTSVVDLTVGTPTIAFDMYTLSQITPTSYTIKANDMFDLDSSDGSDTLTDAAGENSVMLADGSTLTTVNAGDGDDIIMVQAMSTNVTVNGGADDDILVFSDTDGATTDLDNVTNVEIISLSGGAATITTVDAFNDINVQQAGVTINAKDITGALTFDASNETSSSGTITAAGFFTVMGSAQADTITGGDGSDTFYADDTDVIDGGSNYTLDRANGSNGDTVIFDAAVASANLLDTNLANIETIVVTDIGADGTEVYDFSAQSESLFINVVAGKDNAGADITTGTTIKGGTAADTIIGGAGDDTITGDAGDDIIILGAGADTVTVDAGTDSLSNLATADTLTVNASAIANITSANGNILDMTTLTGYTNNGTVVLNNTGGATAAIKGGAGIEQIIAGANGDTITGGAGADAITMGTGNDTAIIAAAGDTGTLTYSDVDSSGTVNDTDTVTGAFDVITSFTTYASNNNADGDDLVISSVNSASASGDILTGLNANEYQILQGTWDATNAKFTIDSTNGTDQLIAFDDGTNDVAVVLLGITDFDATQDFGQ
ncbi:DUF4214 domain-containing protein [Sulfurimonas sp. ST-27]|uniref:DUF4214 domain-containing protein n=1 Tax=Sulfurimonas sp. ST-27 TaxID=3400152 RepID=UPI003AB8A531